ncbi:hypothetical protein JZ751_009965 [Albula glossodonta]|uniref:Uncharacterized protein n=1 Tax=Albula glossodonta TaxID=121402 RepID=A0A8T2P7A1_9TELE|nr:hypothetical protein JZ751_009965 [Albula glossodonta]
MCPPAPHLQPASTLPTSTKAHKLLSTAQADCVQQIPRLQLLPLGRSDHLLHLSQLTGLCPGGLQRRQDCLYALGLLQQTPANYRHLILTLWLSLNRF